MIKDCPLWESALSDWKLSAEKLDELSALLDAIPASKLPEAPTAEQAQLKYIALKVAEIKRRNQEKKINNRFAYLRKLMQKDMETSVYKGYKRDKIEMRGDRAEMSDFPLYLNTVAGGLDRRDQTIGGFSFVVKIYAVPVVEIIG